MEIKIDSSTEFTYSYFNPMLIKVNDKIYFYNYDIGSLDRHRLRDLKTDKICICAEYEDDLLSYLIENNACIIKE